MDNKIIDLCSNLSVRLEVLACILNHAELLANSECRRSNEFLELREEFLSLVTDELYIIVNKLNNLDIDKYC